MRKEPYFTNENRETKTAEWKEILSKYYSSKKKFAFTMENSALLIIDMQEYFLNSNSYAFIPASKAIIEPILRLKKAFEKNNKGVFFTQYGLQPVIDDSSMMHRWWKKTLSTKDSMFEISSEMNADEKSVYFKSTYDIFETTSLALNLDKQGITKLVITGVATHLCCEAIARSAFDLGFEVYLPIDCMATSTEEFHLNSLKAASNGFGIPITSEEILEKAK